jgi:hypothetical protein
MHRPVVCQGSMHIEMMAVTSEHQKFCCVADVLTYESTWLVADLTAGPPLAKL